MQGDGSQWEVSDHTRLCRFLCYGSDQMTYTAREQAGLGMERVGSMLSMLQEGQGVQVVETIQRFAQDGQAVRLEPCIFALALCSQHSELKTRQAAFKALKEVCPQPAHLFSFIQYKKELKEDMKCGMWGRALRKAVSDWYSGQDALSLAAAVSTCKQRQGWSHQDLLRLSHTKPADEAIALICQYVTKEWKDVQVAYADKDNSDEVSKVLSYLEVVEKARHSCDETEVITLIEEHNLEREQLLTDHLKSKSVWRALLKEMPLHSVLKILGKMTFKKVLQPGSSETEVLCETIRSEAALKKAKVHPFSIQLASENYKRGQGYEGKTKWEADANILKALDFAFYKSFFNVEPVGKRFIVAVDVSTSLNSMVPGTSVSTAVAAALIAMVFARTEKGTRVLKYSEGALKPCSVSADMTLAQMTDELIKISVKSTDCTLPITWATKKGRPADVFIILTNNALSPLSANPVAALKKHRKKTRCQSKLVICGLTSGGGTLVDLGDRGLLNISGFDLGAFTVIRNFANNLV
ncbi:RNA-binding protein RO60-like [Entelurus aequoreus]|uniref:RNA-binding protein RO60-like n=1 Tax=Entelurus aequoreus TaxID=161455 RepID=UPI002B1DEE9F|nr:RNA-binding protein RO60-like [Entelurus aequoreus]